MMSLYSISPQFPVSYESQRTPLPLDSNLKSVIAALENLGDEMNKSFKSLEGRLKAIETDLTLIECIGQAQLMDVTEKAQVTNPAPLLTPPSVLGKRTADSIVSAQQPPSKILCPTEEVSCDKLVTEIENLVNSVAADHKEIIDLSNNAFTTVFFHTNYTEKHSRLLNALANYIKDPLQNKLPFSFSDVPKFIVQGISQKKFVHLFPHRDNTIVTGARCFNKDSNTFIEDPLLSYFASEIYFNRNSLGGFYFLDKMRSKVYGSTPLSLTITENGIKKNEYHGLNIFTLDLVLCCLRSHPFSGFGNLTEEELDLLLVPAISVENGVKKKFFPLKMGATVLFRNKDARIFPSKVSHLQSFLTPALVLEATEPTIPTSHYYIDECVSKIKTIRQLSGHGQMDCPELRIKAPKILENLKRLHKRKKNRGDELNLEEYIKKIGVTEPHESTNLLYKKGLELLATFEVKIPLIVGKLQ